MTTLSRTLRAAVLLAARVLRFATPVVAGHRGTANGTPVIIRYCTGKSNQRWNVSANTITGAQSNFCADASGRATANGTKVILWSCGGQANQQWSLR